MKKVKFLLLGILSILLVSPVVAEDIDLTKKPSSLISFESLNSNFNITYGFFPRIYNKNVSSYSSVFYLDSNLNQQYDIGFFNSKSDQIGSTFIYSGLAFESSGGYSLYNTSFSGYFGYINLGSYNNVINLHDFFVYLQTDNGNRINRLLNFGFDYTPGLNHVSVNGSYIRALYSYNSTGFWFSSSNFPTSSTVAPPTSIQVFDGTNNLYTNKGRAVYNGIYFDKVVSGPGNGFSFISSLGTYGTGSFYYDDIKFYSVLPYWDSSWSSSSFYNIPSSYIIPGIYIFRLNSFGRNSNFDDIGVISKCTPSLCGGLSNLEDYLSSLVVSNYLCDFSSSFNLNDNCILVGGGILYKVLGSITGLNQSLTSDNLPEFLRNYGMQYNTYNTNYYSVGNSYNLLSNPYRLTTSFFHLVDSPWAAGDTSSIITNSYDIIYTGGYSISNPPDVLGNGDFTIPDDPSQGGGSSSGGNIDLNSGSAVDVLDILCNSSVIKPVWCNRINEVAPGVDGFWWLDLSGNLVYSLVGYDQDNGGYWYDLQSDGSGGYQFVCDIETDYFCPLTGSIGSFDIISPADPHGIGFSGFILSQDYYDNFFTKTGYFAKCPYPYTDFNIGLHNKVLNKFYDTLGFDIFLPVNCGVAAFTAGKTFRFLSDVSLGLSPLMGEIHSPSDPRVYLYRFLDFLLSFALFMFLLKLYHLLN